MQEDSDNKQETPLNTKELRELFEKALDEEIGLAYITNDAIVFRRRFYLIRRKLREEGDLTLENLSCKVIADDTVFLIKNRR